MNILKIITLGDIETEKQKFHYCKNPILVKDVDFDKVLISYIVSFIAKESINDEYNNDW